VHTIFMMAIRFSYVLYFSFHPSIPQLSTKKNYKESVALAPFYRGTGAL